MSRNKAVRESIDLVGNGIEDDSEYLHVLRVRRGLSAELKQAGGIKTPTVVDAIEVMDNLDVALKAFENSRGFATRKGEWMPTYSGRLFWLLDPRADEVEAADIARGLARIARFNGGTIGNGFSVAQHSLLASAMAPEWCALPALLHDAHEAYIGDQTGPWKKAVASNLKAVEDPIKAAIAERFGFEWTDEVNQQVKVIDRMLLATEARDLVPAGTLYADSEYEPFDFQIEPMHSDLAEVLFLQRLDQLVNLVDEDD